MSFATVLRIPSLLNWKRISLTVNTFLQYKKKLTHKQLYKSTHNKSPFHNLGLNYGFIHDDHVQYIPQKSANSPHVHVNN